LRNIILSALLLTTATTPAFADPVSGFYAGIYGGGGTHSSADYQIGAVTGISGIAPGPIDDSLNVDDEPLNPELAHYIEWLEQHVDSEHDAAVAVWGVARGALDLLAAPQFGGVVGYGFGNGLRVEADLSSATHSAGAFGVDYGRYQLAVGKKIEGSWDWDVYMAGESIAEFLELTDVIGDDLTYTSSVQFLLASAYYDIDTGTAFTPYIGAGAGVAHVTGTLSALDHDLTASAIVPAGQVGAGVRVDVSGPVSIDLGYRLRVAADPALAMSSEVNSYDLLRFESSGPIVTHGLQVGLNINFQ
jgi:opacity protein-like surface antigen